MTLPAKADLIGLEYVLNGEPFVWTSADPDLDLNTLDYALDGQPFAANPYSTSVIVTTSYTVTDSLVTVKQINKIISFPLATDLDSDLSPSNISFPLTLGFTTTKQVNKTFSYAETTSFAALTGNPVSAMFTVVTGFSTIKQVNKIRTYDTVTDFTSSEMVTGAYDTSFTLRLSVLQSDDNSFSNRLSVLSASDSSFSTLLGVMEYDLAAVTSVCSVSNPFQPAIIINGQYVTPFTAPFIPDPSQYFLFVNMQNSGVTGIDVCKLHNFGFTLDNSGGSWFLTVPEDIYDCFDEIQIFGFNGLVSAKGIELSNNGAGFNYSGNFATNELNLNMEYLFYGSPVFTKLLSNQNLTPNEKNIWATARSAAQQIAARSGTTLHWLIPDQPLPGFKPQEGLNAISALASLAQQAGGVLRWNGNSKFKVVFPDFFEGIWQIPSCDLIISPVKCETFCDLARGRNKSASNRAIAPGFIRSQPSNTDATKLALPSKPGDTTPPQVQLLTKITQRLTENNPPLIFDLPYNYKDVYIQILVPSKGSTGGNNTVSLKNFITKNPKEYFELALGSLASNYIFVTNIGGVQQPQVKFDYKLLPVEGTNSTIDAGEFVASLYYTTNELSVPDSDDEIQNRSNLSGQLRYLFYKTNSCTFSTIFFGSLPIPGMKAVGTIPDVKLYIPDGLGGYTTQELGDVVLDGIIDSVTFNYPGTVTVTTSNYRRLLLYNRSEVDGTIPGE